MTPQLKDAPFEPREDYILVENKLRREITIHLPGVEMPKDICGNYILKVGPGRVKDDGTLINVPSDLKPGVEVLLNNGACIGFQHAITGTGQTGRKFVLVRPADVLAIVKEVEVTPLSETEKILLQAAQ